MLWIGRSGHRGAAGAPWVAAGLTAGIGSKTGTERAGATPGSPSLLWWRGACWACAARSEVMATGQRPDASSVMACWHWNRQPTQPPAAARWRRVAMKIAKARGGHGRADGRRDDRDQ